MAPANLQSVALTRMQSIHVIDYWLSIKNAAGVLDHFCQVENFAISPFFSPSSDCLPVGHI
jgi:hypothetical protein